LRIRGEDRREKAGVGQTEGGQKAETEGGAVVSRVLKVN
jgi:hypothetical protein